MVQAFAAPERLQEVCGRVRAALQEALPAAAAKMRLYLSNPATHAILFRPIKSNIAEAHGQVQFSSPCSLCHQAACSYRCYFTQWLREQPQEQIKVFPGHLQYSHALQTALAKVCSLDIIGYSR